MTKSESDSASEKLNLNVLTKFIKLFDDDRESLTAFLTNCDNAIALATTSQRDVLCKFILSQLEGKAELKSFQKSTFEEKKHSTHRLIDIQNWKHSE